jgi:hypothetical protein
VLSEDDIWKTALGVWAELQNAKIASGFIQAHHIAAHVIKAGGGNKFRGNKFLGIGGTGHVGVHQTDDGLVWIDSNIFPASKKLYLKFIAFIETFHLFYIVINLILVSNKRVPALIYVVEYLQVSLLEFTMAKMCKNQALHKL